MVTDNLDGVLVSTNCTVRAETPELTSNCSLWSSVELTFGWEREVSNVICDTDCEAWLVVFLEGSVPVNSLNLVRSCILGTETVSTASDNNVIELSALESSNNVEVERFAESTWFLGSVENRNLLNSVRNSFDELVSAERSVKTNLNETELSAFSVEEIDCFFDCITYRTHSDDNVISVRSTVVVEELVVCTDLLVNLVHVVFNDSRELVVEFVTSFTSLEEDITVLSSTAENRVFRVKSTVSESLSSLLVEHIFEILVIPSFNLLDFVRSTETIEEVENRNSALDCGKVSNSAEVHNFLNVGSTEHSETCLTARINVRVITEDVKSVGSNTSCRNVNYAREKLTSNLIHIRDHKKKTLRSCISSCKSTSSERAVYSTCSTGFRLHFSNLYRLTEDVVLLLSSPLVSNLSHNRGRGDRVDSSNVSEWVGDPSSSVVTVHGFH